VRYTYAELANLAINQTLVRSINTSVVALLPVSAILFIGSLLLGAGTLQDIALALFVGMAVGTYSSIFVATPLEVAFRGNEAKIREHTAKVLALRESGEADVALNEDGQVRVGALAPGGHLGTAAQPKRKRRK
ncbi:MAG: protein translocase subunit SecF, partial [Demequina sp.]